MRFSLRLLALSLALGVLGTGAARAWQIVRRDVGLDEAVRGSEVVVRATYRGPGPRYTARWRVRSVLRGDPRLAGRTIGVHGVSFSEMRMAGRVYRETGEQRWPLVDRLEPADPSPLALGRTYCVLLDEAITERGTEHEYAVESGYVAEPRCAEVERILAGPR